MEHEEGHGKPGADEHAQPSILRSLEERHLADLEHKPGAVLRAVVIWLVVIVVGGGGLLLASRHLKDHHQRVSVDEIFVRAARPPVSQSALRRLLAPDYSCLVKTELRGVRFLDGERLVLADGSFLQLTGVGDLKTLLGGCASEKGPPVVHATIAGGKVQVERLLCGAQPVAKGGELQRVAKLDPTAAPPQRSASPSPGVFHEFTALPLEHDELLQGTIGAWISLKGNLKEEGGRLTLRMADGAGLVVSEAREGSSVDRFLKAFAGQTSPVQLDLVVGGVYPWDDPRDPQHSRKQVHLAGEAVVYSASAQNYHAADRR